MEKHIMGENGISYTLGEDGLYYPDLYLPEETEYPIGKYGMLRKIYLQEHRKGLYLELVLAGKLNEHLHQIDKECNQMMDRLVEQMKEKQGVTEELKMQDQMAWVGRMNNIRACVEEIVLNGHCSFTNNLSENAIRPFAVGRKNWLFSSSVDGANASAVVYTMVEMAKAHGLNIYGYLKFLLEHRPSKDMTDEQLAELAPWSEKLQSVKNRM